MNVQVMLLGGCKVQTDLLNQNNVFSNQEWFKMDFKLARSPIQFIAECVFKHKKSFPFVKAVINAFRICIRLKSTWTQPEEEDLWYILAGSMDRIWQQIPYWAGFRISGNIWVWVEYGKGVRQHRAVM